MNFYYSQSMYKSNANNTDCNMMDLLLKHIRQNDKKPLDFNL